MVRERNSLFSFRCLSFIIFILSIFSVSLFLSCGHCWGQCYYSPYQILEKKPNQPTIDDLRSYPFAWNHLTFSSSDAPPKLLKIALFVKKWPQRSRAGGLERHALTLHLALAKRGHHLHIFTTNSSSLPNHDPLMTNLHFHLSKPTPAGYLDQASVWEQFQAQNSSGKPFDVVHTESIGLRYTRSRYVANLAVTWHGIAYETIHSDIIQELLRSPQEPPPKALTERAMKVVEEVRFFPNYAHHVATSIHAGDILKRVYMIPEERVHIILNGVDQEVFKPDIFKAREFKQRHGIPEDSKPLVIGLAGRLVKDKGHPLMFEALKQMIAENSTFQESRMRMMILVAGDGPWAARYRDLGSNSVNIKVLGPLEQDELACFYNAIDIFLNPTLRAQGLDHTLLEAMLCGKPVMATRLASIMGSVIVGTEMGYTFSPTVSSLKKAIYEVVDSGRAVLEKKGQVARQRGLQLFTANKMVAAYERLFLCLSSRNNGDDFCRYTY
ncbi:putative glycosyltransferase epsF [Senna tora]|uniref:Putative glycosyltransferase epsF n=1 Tax=Senna tora TaxID=362788 RepID=A0A834WJX2_9FABA|nr:putative glycosyltransferase epsF [Senna tora]